MTYLGYSIVSTISGYVYRKPGGNGGTAKTLLAAMTRVRALNGEPKSTGAVMPEERDTNRIGRDWARREVRDNPTTPPDKSRASK